jgi:hypothetical protein
MSRETNRARLTPARTSWRVWQVAEPGATYFSKKKIKGKLAFEDRNRLYLHIIEAKSGASFGRRRNHELFPEFIWQKRMMDDGCKMMHPYTTSAKSPADNNGFPTTSTTSPCHSVVW